MTYNVFSGTLNPTHFTSRAVLVTSVSQVLTQAGFTGVQKQLFMSREQG